MRLFCLVLCGLMVGLVNPSHANPVFADGFEKFQLADFAQRPYADDSPWNTPIPDDPVVHARSPQWIARLESLNKPLTSATHEYTIPVFYADATSPRRDIQIIGGYYSRYVSDTERRSDGFNPIAKSIPIPASAKPGEGTDGQIVIIDQDTGQEYGFWRLREENGQLVASNGYRYHIAWQGRFADGKAGRGAGTTYLAGLVRPSEVQAGVINHALAFGYRWPAHRSVFVYPASKSDGLGDPVADIPEGSRLQLNPKFTDADFDAWGLDARAKVIAVALQRYGMYVIDNSGSSKVYLEADESTDWGWKNNEEGRYLLSKIPWSAFRVVETHQDKKP